MDFSKEEVNFFNGVMEELETFISVLKVFANVYLDKKCLISPTGIINSEYPTFDYQRYQDMKKYIQDTAKKWFDVQESYSIYDCESKVFLIPFVENEDITLDMCQKIILNGNLIAKDVFDGALTETRYQKIKEEHKKLDQFKWWDQPQEEEDKEAA